METSKLEQKTRILADHYMATHPGVERVTAKNRVRSIAAVQLAVAALVADMRGFAAAGNRAGRSLRLVTDAWLEPTPSEPARAPDRTPERARPFERASR